MTEKSIGFNFNETNLIDNTILFFYSLSLISGTIQLSMFTYYISGSLLVFTRLAMCGCAFILSLIFKRFNLKSIVGISFSIVGIIVFLKTRNLDYLLFAMTLTGLKDIPVKRVVKLTFIITLVSLLILVLLSITGIIPNLGYPRNGRIRNSFGTTYPLVLSAYLFYLAVSVSILWPKKTFVTLSIMTLLMILCNTYTGSRNDTFSIALLILIIVLKKYLKLAKILLKTLIPIFVVVGIVFSIFLTKLIPFGTNLFVIINKLLSDRLILQDTLVNNYGIKLFGQVIVQNGNGGYEGQNSLMQYFYIDNSYAASLYVGGLLSFCFIVGICAYRCYSLIKKDFVIVGLILFIVIINGMVESSFINTSLNTIIPILLSDPKLFLSNEKLNLVE
ncbi:hypothetical protein [Pediococcus argentinicus]|uniref:hypothetical protein n=1 Tax=Pediococcus argentinicus TaxID=480391 RepID=UPI000710AAF2|nr:hypothetical protein [Pediococcus argentinicus]NKZ22506.1 hypothetical protein [Pediococcus argentinicus]GEP20404.1 hypothetical protein LSA03_17880 [Pediococcus argentinicus]